MSDEIPDIRDIEVKILNAYAPCNLALLPFVGKYRLRNYRGPISAIIAQCDGGKFSIKIELRVLDTQMQMPVYLTIEKWFAQYNLEECHDKQRYFEHQLREAIIWATTHEIDESLLRDGEFVTDPHPERQLRKPDTLPLAVIEHAAEVLKQSAVT